MRYFLCALMVLLVPTLAAADVIINEAMINEPGAHTTLEWVELHNTADTTAYLPGYELDDDGDRLPLTGSIPPKGYSIICRRLFSSGTTPGFEEYWGNNSGVWGDDPKENYAQPLEWSSLSLSNTYDELYLVQGPDTVSYFYWFIEQADNVSLERRGGPNDPLRTCIDSSGSTPGRENSVALRPRDLRVSCFVLKALTHETDFKLTVFNDGRETVQNARIHIAYAYGPVPEGEDSVIWSSVIAPLDSGRNVIFGPDLHIPGSYVPMVAELSTDDRLENNRFQFNLPGEQFPPVIFTEAMLGSSVYSKTAWVEFLNRSNESTQLLGLRVWAFASGHGDSIVRSSTVLEPGERLILAQDTNAFKSSYPQYSGKLAQPRLWPGFKPSSDSWLMPYSEFVLGDSLGYTLPPPTGFSLSRDIDVLDPPRWGISAALGGTPGAPNDVVFRPHDENLSLTIVPRVFSPDGDGREEMASITVSAPPASSYSLKIYNREGQLVRTLFEAVAYLADEYTFDGRAGTGDRLPIGIYIVVLESDGKESAKTTVVIAR